MTATPTPGFHFDDSTIVWRRFRALEGVYCRLLDVDTERQNVDRLMKVNPKRSSVRHRHTGICKTFMLEGEHHVFRPDGKGGTETVIRPTGLWATREGNDTICDIRDDDLHLGRAISVTDFRRGLTKQRADAGA